MKPHMSFKHNFINESLRALVALVTLVARMSRQMNLQGTFSCQFSIANVAINSTRVYLNMSIVRKFLQKFATKSTVDSLWIIGILIGTIMLFSLVHVSKILITKSTVSLIVSAKIHLGSTSFLLA